MSHELESAEARLEYLEREIEDNPEPNYHWFIFAALVVIARILILQLRIAERGKS